MHIKQSLIGAAAAIAMLGTAACTTNPETGKRSVSKAAIGVGAGALGGYLLGDVVGGRRDRTEKIAGAGIGAIAGGAIGAYMDKQERELREKTAGTDIQVDRQGDQITLNMPSGITFDTNSYVIKPEFRSTLDNVASTLANYQQTFVDVYGHTDSTGGPSINQPLSENRARSVADYLATRGVSAARVGTRGFGATQPVASNDTESGRQANRRVEIKLVPISTTAG
jgi:outer membrane protein OmpA-like peptidoglycan-associated protein